jgi:hypothetical protein
MTENAQIVADLCSSESQKLISKLRQRYPALPHIFARAVGIARFARLIAFKKKELARALIGVNLGRQRCGVGKFKRHMPLPTRLERRDVDDNPAARIGGFAKTDDKYITGNTEIFNRPGQSKAVWRDDAHISFAINKAVGIKLFGINHA